MVTKVSLKSNSYSLINKLANVYNEVRTEWSLCIKEERKGSIPR